jgi:uncharacterized damage-inducible protein DinB
MSRPQPDEFGIFYQKYIDTVSDDVIADLQSQALSFPEFLTSIPLEKYNYAYADGKWTIKELVGHVIDTERIMTYRLTRFARLDGTELPGFEENSYVANAHFNDRSMESLIEEFRLLRLSNMHLFSSLNEEELERKGLANGHVISVKALLFVIAGHLKHHRNIITDRYL